MDVKDRTNIIILNHEVKSTEIQEIITSVPSWIVRWGTAIVLLVLAGIVLLSSLINYPDVVKTTLKINSLNAPKSVLAGQSGKLVSLLVKEGEKVKSNQLIAFLESTASPHDVLLLANRLEQFRTSFYTSQNLKTLYLPDRLNLGDLQDSYGRFFEKYLLYIDTRDGGYYTNQKKILEDDLNNSSIALKHKMKEREIMTKESDNLEIEFQAYKKLYEKKMISRSEFAQQENKYLASKHPLNNNGLEILNNNSKTNATKKELLEMQHLIQEQRSNFNLALNVFISEIDEWIHKFILKSPVSGQLNYAGIIQENQNVALNQELFIVNPGNTDFFGEIYIPQYNMGKVKIGQNTLVKMRSYPFEQYGLIHGRIDYISEVSNRDSVFAAKVKFLRFEYKDPGRKLFLKNGMIADVEIITEESSLLQRFFRNVIKVLKSK